MIPLAHNLMLLTELQDDRMNVWDFKKSFVKWSKIEVPVVVAALLTLLYHGSYMIAAVHAVYVAYIVFKYANGDITEIDPTAIMMPKYQDDVSSALTYRLVYYICAAFILFFGLVYFTAQWFLRSPHSIEGLNNMFERMFPSMMQNRMPYVRL
tara:strand:+ start:1060 stop:1518 length:459 start_codon:yes stop_codon:yes gene_type:complete